MTQCWSHQGPREQPGSSDNSKKRDQRCPQLWAGLGHLCVAYRLRKHQGLPFWLWAPNSSVLGQDGVGDQAAALSSPLSASSLQCLH